VLGPPRDDGASYVWAGLLRNDQGFVTTRAEIMPNTCHWLRNTQMMAPGGLKSCPANVDCLTKQIKPSIMIGLWASIGSPLGVSWGPLASMGSLWDPFYRIKIQQKNDFLRKVEFSALVSQSAFGTNTVVLTSSCFHTKKQDLLTPQYLLCQMHLGH
jgi:hypothetical protein